jgi:hypothetical protein
VLIICDLFKLCSNKFTWCFHKQNYYRVKYLEPVVVYKQVVEAGRF